MKSENDVQVQQLPEDSDSDSSATPSPPKNKKSRVSTREPCLICSKNENQNSSPEDDPLSQEFELFQFPGASGSNLLNQQMWTTFVLRKLLKLPLSKFSDILKTAGSCIHPHQWFSLCRECSEMVNSIAESEVTIKLLQQKIRTITGTIKRKLEESLEAEARKNRRKDKDNFFVIRSEIRETLNTKASKKTTTATATPHAAVSTSSTPLISSTSSTQAPMTMLEPLVEQKPEINLIYLDYSELATLQKTEHHHDDHDDKDLSTPPRSPPSPVEVSQRSDSDEEWIPNPSTPKSKSGSMSRSRKRFRDSLEDHNDDDDQNEDEDQEESELEDQNESDSDLEADSMRKSPRQKKQKNVKKKMSRSKANETGEHRCHICPRSFGAKDLLQKHLKYHRKTQKLYGGKLDCVLCKWPYDKFLTLSGHYLQVHGKSIHRSWDGEAPHDDYLYTDEESKKLMLENLKSKGVDTKAKPALKLDENNDLEHKCHLCPKQYSRSNDFKKHLWYHKHCETEYQGRFDCFKCKMPHASAQTLRQHFSFDHKLILDKEWDPNTPQMDHVKPKPGVNNKCEICGFVCKRSSGLKRHMIYKHRDHPSNKGKGKKGGELEETDKFVCDKCGFDCGRKSKLDQHIFNHKIYDNSVDPSISATDFVCNLCQKTVSTRLILYRHKIQQHHEELNIPVEKCEECPKVFKRKSQLSGHVQIIHRRLGKYNCDQCPFASMREDGIRKHMQKHGETREKNFVCEFCSASYCHLSELNGHLQRYHLEQYHPSRNQGVFGGVAVEKLKYEETLGVLKRVRKQGQKMKPVNCKYCKDVLPHALAFKMHLRSVHQDLYVHKCDIEDCGRTYMSLHSLKLHKKSNHDQK